MKVGNASEPVIVPSANQPNTRGGRWGLRA